MPDTPEQNECPDTKQAGYSPPPARSWKPWSLVSRPTSIPLAQTIELERVSDGGFATSVVRAGHIMGGHRVAGRSPFGNGSDAVVGLGIATQIAGELCTGAMLLHPAALRPERKLDGRLT